MSATPVRMFPEEVAAMSDEELSLHIAEVVFGAKSVNYAGYICHTDALARQHRGRVGLAPPCGEFELRTWLDPFSPSNPVAVDYVREHMRERWDAGRVDGCWHLRETGRGWRAEVWNGDDQVVFSCFAESLGRALFEAALLSAQEMQPPVSEATPNELEAG